MTNDVRYACFFQLSSLHVRLLNACPQDVHHNMNNVSSWVHVANPDALEKPDVFFVGECSSGGVFHQCWDKVDVHIGSILGDRRVK